MSPYPLDVLGAESEGMIGYLVAQALANAVSGLEIATLLTQVAVDPADPAFATPTKPIGPIYDEAEMRRLAAQAQWSFARDAHGFRRTVASPAPRRIVEIGAIKSLVRAGMAVVCAGGGGIPVVADAQGLRGIEAVIDKDRTSALLAEELGADALLLLTDVPAVLTQWPAPEGKPHRSHVIGKPQGASLRSGLDGSEGRGGLSFCRSHRALCRYRRDRGRRGNPDRTGRNHHPGKARIGVARRLLDFGQ